ncbi:dihydrofolate reductase family protein [Parapedobacter tibetensis]|uniref:dihydrofolate reductase family protein n=1 Tax=Parapedobacter tibetensis TaxID=2972951 RepID=UPI00214D3B42|nr:dihydrofolate reductase family protein [Parapedobacter tibetensis]
MRKLKVQMNFEGIHWDDDMVTFCIDNLKNVDNILLGRITAEAFIPYWKEVAENPRPNDINNRVGKPINDISKVIFSNKLKSNKWDNTTIIKGDLEEEIKNLKENNGKDIIVYGGNSFVSSLVEHRLVDEYYLFIDPLAISRDEPILKFINSSLSLQLKECKPFECGTILLGYTRQK